MPYAAPEAAELREGWWMGFADPSVETSYVADMDERHNWRKMKVLAILLFVVNTMGLISISLEDWSGLMPDSKWAAAWAHLRILIYFVPLLWSLLLLPVARVLKSRLGVLYGDTIVAWATITMMLQMMRSRYRIARILGGDGTELYPTEVSQSAIRRSFSACS